MDALQCIKLKYGYLVVNTNTLQRRFLSFAEMDNLSHSPEALSSLIKAMDGVPFENRLIPLDAIGTQANVHLLPTYNCNYQCSYCYEKKRKHKFDHMTPQHIQHVKDFYKLYNEVFSCNIEYAQIVVSGGEPFLPSNRETISSILCNWAETPVQFITNGSNVLNYFDILDTHDALTLSFSIDGTKEMHNKKRFSSNPTQYDNMIKAIHAALDKGYHIALSSLYHPEFESQYSEYFDFLESLGWPNNPQIITRFGLIVSGDGVGFFDDEYLKASLASLSALKRKDGRVEHFNLSEMIPGCRNLINAMCNANSGFYRPHRCPAVSSPSFAFMPDGYVSICSTIDQEIGYIGRFWPDVEIYVDKLKKLQGRRIEILSPCNICDKRVFCLGGCPATALSETQDLYGTYCGIWDKSTIYKYIDDFLF